MRPGQTLSARASTALGEGPGPFPFPDSTPCEGLGPCEIVQCELVSPRAYRGPEASRMHCSGLKRAQTSGAGTGRF